jgi:hypothetical protein
MLDVSLHPLSIYTTDVNFSFPRKFFAPLCAVWVLLSLAAPGRSAGDEPNEADARKVFLATEAIFRSPLDVQREHSGEIYTAFPRLQACDLSSAPYYPQPSELQRTPEELADKIAKGYGGMHLYSVAFRRSQEILAHTQEALAPLLTRDLASADKAERYRALLVIEEVRLPAYFDAVVHNLRTETDAMNRTWSLYALRSIGDPRAIPVIVALQPDLGQDVDLVLPHLQAGHPADPSLVALLDSRNALVHYRATDALAGSGDPSLIPYFQKLVKDGDSKVRVRAVAMGFAMQGDAFQKVRPLLVEALSDSNSEVRLAAAAPFAQQHDAVCAPALLDLLTHTPLTDPLGQRVAQSIQDLTSTYFGYWNKPPTGPTPESRDRAVEEFAAWIQAHSGKAPAP